MNKDDNHKSISDANKILFEKGFKKATGNDLDLAKVKEILHSSLTDSEYYRWIDKLDVETDGSSIAIIAPYKETAVYVNEF